MDQLPVYQPKSPKVFGILHIIFGVLGIFGLLWGFIWLIFYEPFLNWMAELLAEATSSAGGAGAATTPDLSEMMNLIIDLQKETAIANWINMILSLVVTVLIFRAGIKLVRYKRDSLKASNAYAWASLGAKVLGIVLFLTVMAGPTARYNERMNELAGADAGSSPMEQMAATGGSLLSFIFSMIYPLLALVLLNKPVVKEYLAKLGK